MFNQYLARLNEIAQNPSNENFVELQKLRADILTAYTEGLLSDFEKRHLCGISAIIIGEICETLKEKSGEN